MRQSDRIARLSRRMALACRLLAYGLPLAICGLWLTIEHMQGQDYPARFLIDLTIWDRAGGLAIGLLAYSVTFWGLINLARLFQRFSRGETLDRRAAKHLQRFALAVLLFPLVRMVSSTLTIPWLSRDAPPGQGMLSISLSSDGIAFIVVGLLLVTLSWVLAQAADVAEDQKLIV